MSDEISDQSPKQFWRQYNRMKNITYKLQ